MFGRYPPLSTRLYIRALLTVAIAIFTVSVFFGVISYLIEPQILENIRNRSFLNNIEDIRTAYCVGNWHNGAYYAALPAIITAGFWAQWKRRKLATSMTEQKT